MDKFKCTGCGSCCRDFGKRKTLPLFNNEKERIKELAEKLDILVRFVPENVMIDIKTNVLLCSNWGLLGNPCPFLDKNNKCKIYENRPLVCKAFPLEKIPDKNSELKLKYFMSCPSFNNKKFIDSGKPLTEIYEKISIQARLEIQRREREISEKIFGLIFAEKIDLKKITKFYSPDVISVETFLKIAGL